MSKLKNIIVIILIVSNILLISNSYNQQKKIDYLTDSVDTIADSLDFGYYEE